MKKAFYILFLIAAAAFWIDVMTVRQLVELDGLQHMHQDMKWSVSYILVTIRYLGVALIVPIAAFCLLIRELLSFRPAQ